jgi:hypothetical protein
MDLLAFFFNKFAKLNTKLIFLSFNEGIPIKLQLDYSSIQWIVYIFLAGAIYAVLLKNFVDWYNLTSYLSSENLFWIIFFVFGTGLFLAPIILSLIFSRFQPKRLVPPLMIATISYSLLIWLLFTRMDYFIQYSYFLGMYIFTAGFVQDAISIYFLGINAQSENILRYSFSVNCNFKKVNELVEDERFREIFSFRSKLKTKDNSLKLKSTTKNKFKVILEVKESDKPDQSIVNIAVYHERRYDVKPLSEDKLITDFARNKLVSIKDYFLRNYSLSTLELPDSAADSTVNWVLNDCRGAAVQLQEMPMRKQVFIFIGLIFIGVSIGTFAFGKIDWSLASIPIALVLLVDGIRD